MPHNLFLCCPSRPCISQQVKWLEGERKASLAPLFTLLLCLHPPPHPPLCVSVFLFPFQCTVHSDVSLELLPLDTSEGPCKGNDRTCIPPFFSFCLALPFALLRMADYLSLHGLSGADRRLSWRGRPRAEPTRGPCLSTCADITHNNAERTNALAAIPTQPTRRLDVRQGNLGTWIVG